MIGSRRALLIGLVVAPLTVLAQERQRVYRVAILSSSSQTLVGHLMEAFMHGLRELGYVEGKNLLIERRFAGGNLDRLPALAAELAKHRVDLIFVAGTIAAEPARQATSTMPIVFANVHDPVGLGLVESLARPGVNMTGTSSLAPELSGKRLELLKEAFPRISRVAVIISCDASTAVQFAEIQRGAEVLGVRVLSVEVQNRDDFERVLALLREWPADSMFVVQTPTNFYNRRLLAELAAKMRLPSVSSSEEFAEAGHIISYGANLKALYRRAASYVDKILKGAKPGDLPVEQPTTFELVINLRRAKTLASRFHSQSFCALTG